MTLTLNASALTYIDGDGSEGAHVSGAMVFDSSLLDMNDSGVVGTNGYSINGGIV